ncbi:MAG: hypothetical protein HY937_01145 [Nitrosomonadales bacterium]|nr:hypothetical protein [Nitrosomonadales bacterium]
MSSSNDAKPKAEAGTNEASERRKHLNLREIFEDACWITKPFFDSTQTWGNASLTIYARQALCEAYPSLTQQEIAILYASVERHHKAVLNRKK